MSGPRPAPGADAGEPRPPLGGWTRVYALVIAELALTIVLLLALTRAFR